MNYRKRYKVVANSLKQIIYIHINMNWIIQIPIRIWIILPFMRTVFVFPVSKKTPFSDSRHLTIDTRPALKRSRRIRAIFRKNLLCSVSRIHTVQLLLTRLTNITSCKIMERNKKNDVRKNGNFSRIQRPSFSSVQSVHSLRSVVKITLGYLGKKDLKIIN